MSSLPIPDGLTQGRVLRDAVLTTLIDAAPADCAYLVDLITRVGTIRAVFTADDVFDALDRPLASPSIIGAAFRIAQKRALIEKTGTFVSSRRANQHATTIFCYRLCPTIGA